MSEREEIISKRRFLYSICSEGLCMRSLETPLLVFSCDGCQSREVDCGRTVCGSARITNDLAGSSLNSAILNAPLSVSPQGPRLWVEEWAFWE